jgi:hypothetical protein
MKRNQLHSYIYLVSFMLILSCTNSSLEKYDDIRDKTVFESKVPLNEYKRDSSFLHFTVKRFIEHGYKDYQYVNRFGKENLNKVNISIDDIFYSPDGLKLIAFVILEIPVNIEKNKNSLENPNLSHFYNGHLLQAYRKKTDTLWDVYCSYVYRCQNYESIKKVRYKYRKFFFDEMKSKKGHDYNCNLNETCFWTSTNIMWRKGDVIPGFYNFQINTNRYYYERGKNDKPLSDFLIDRLPHAVARLN